MGTKRHSKTASQQCRYYEVDNIFEYMVDTYINGNITSFKDIYRELNKGARRDFVDFIFNEVNPKYTIELIKQTICPLPQFFVLSAIIILLIVIQILCY